MKQKITLSLFFVVIILSILIPNQVWAITSMGGYTIENYDIDMIVNENNTFDITEKITANFTGFDKHGIFRKIPLRNSITRLDGTESKNRAKISNISVSEKYKTSKKNGYKVLKIGDENTTVSGEKTYIIKYNYNIGKDPLKDADELYFNLIGDEWDTSISHVSFNIVMPKQFDKAKLGFSSGYTTSTDNSNITYTVNGNTIKGELIEELGENQALTVRLTLSEGYFVGASSNFDYTILLQIGISIIFVFIAYGLWSKYGKDEEVIETVEFYPPDGLNSAEIGFLYKGYSDKKDVISLLIYLANKGYLRIEEYQEGKLIKNKQFVIIKVKEYDGNNEDERTFFNDLFRNKDEVTKYDLYDKFYKTLQKVSSNINKKENQQKAFEKASLDKRGIIVVMIVIMFVLMGGLSIFQMGSFSYMTFVIIIMISVISLVYTKTNVWTIILACFTCIGICLFGVINDIMIDTGYLVKFIIQSICMILLIVFLGIMRKRTTYGTKMLGKIKGFKNFLETAEKPKLEELVMEQPEYFYNILPYTYVLGVSNVWMEKFEDIALKAPDWYVGYNDFNVHSFNIFMHSTYSSISNAMSSKEIDSSGSGGGFSGGGSGGGGGGSW